MRYIIFFSGLLAFTWPAKTSSVRSLASFDFPEFIHKHGHVFVEFWAPPCHMCDILDPLLQQAAGNLVKENVTVAKVNCGGSAEAKEICYQYGAMGKPSLMVFNGPQQYKSYPGRESAESIQWYMTQQKTLSWIINIKKENLENFRARCDVAAVAFLSEADTMAMEAYSVIAKQFHGLHNFGFSSDKEFASRTGTDFPGIVVYNQFEPDPSRLDTTAFTEENIRKLIEDAANPLVGDLTYDTFDDYRASAPILAWIFAETRSERLEIALTIRPMAERYRNQIRFCTVDPQRFGMVAGKLGLTYGMWPALSIEDLNHDAFYPLDHNVKWSISAIEQFVASLVDDKSLILPESGYIDSNTHDEL